MKKSILFLTTSILLLACNSPKPEQKTEINQTERNSEENSSELSNQSDTNQAVSNEEEIIIEEIEQTEPKAIQEKPSTAAEHHNRLVGTWLFTKATAGDSDRTTKYPWGYLNGERKKMILLVDGNIQYENDIVDAMKIEKSTWEIEKHKTKDFYYFVTTITANGVTETSKEKILDSKANQFIFGKRFTVEYTSLSK